MDRLGFSLVYGGFKKDLAAALGKEQARLLWKEAGSELASLGKAHRDFPSDARLMLLPLNALYVVMRRHGLCDALAMLREYGRKTGGRLSAAVRAVTSVPGLPLLLWRNMPALIRRASSPKKGYERRILPEADGLVGVDILRCPLHEAAKKLCTPEITSVVCLMDKGQMSGFRRIEYTRTMALGDGDAFCDYRLRFNKDKE